MYHIYRLRDFWYKAQKNMRKMRDSRLEGAGGLEGFQTVVSLEGRMSKVYLTHDVQTFHATITLKGGELEPTCSWFCYHAHQ